MTNTAKVEVSLIFHNTYLLVFQSASSGLPFADILQIHFHCTQFHQFVHYGINGESGSRMNLKFAGNVSPVRNDGMNGNEKLFGNLLVRHSAYNASDNFFFPLT